MKYINEKIRGRAYWEFFTRICIKIPLFNISPFKKNGISYIDVTKKFFRRTYIGKGEDD